MITFTLLVSHTLAHCPPVPSILPHAPEGTPYCKLIILNDKGGRIPTKLKLMSLETRSDLVLLDKISLLLSSYPVGHMP